MVLNASLGFEPDMARAEPVQCGRRRLLVMPATGMTGGAIRTFLAARAVVGATAAYEREPGAWYHDLWILSTPAADGVVLQAWTQGGRAVYAGTGRIENDAFTFELSATAESRVALVDVRGRLSIGAIADRRHAGRSRSVRIAHADPPTALTSALPPGPMVSAAGRCDLFLTNRLSHGHDLPLRPA